MRSSETSSFTFFYHLKESEPKEKGARENGPDPHVADRDRHVPCIERRFQYTVVHTEPVIIRKSPLEETRDFAVGNVTPFSQGETEISCPANV